MALSPHIARALDEELARGKTIGTGTYAKAIVTPDHPELVFTKLHPAVEDKHLLEEVHGRLPSNPHIPPVRFIGTSRGESVYAMPWYKTPPPKGTQARYDAALLFDCWGVQDMDESVECARQNGVSASVVSALEVMKDVAAPSRANYRFEFGLSNLASDARGNLVLLDVLLGEYPTKFQR
jgi:hypothetical protein